MNTGRMAFPSTTIMAAKDDFVKDIELKLGTALREVFANACTYSDDGNLEVIAYLLGYNKNFHYFVVGTNTRPFENITDILNNGCTMHRTGSQGEKSNAIKGCGLAYSACFCSPVSFEHIIIGSNTQKGFKVGKGFRSNAEWKHEDITNEFSEKIEKSCGKKLFKNYNNFFLFPIPVRLDAKDQAEIGKVIVNAQYLSGSMLDEFKSINIKYGSNKLIINSSSKKNDIVEQLEGHERLRHALNLNEYKHNYIHKTFTKSIKNCSYSTDSNGEKIKINFDVEVQLEFFPGLIKNSNKLISIRDLQEKNVVSFPSSFVYCKMSGILDYIKDNETSSVYKRLKSNNVYSSLHSSQVLVDLGLRSCSGKVTVDKDDISFFIEPDKVDVAEDKVKTRHPKVIVSFDVVKINSIEINGEQTNSNDVEFLCCLFGGALTENILMQNRVKMRNFINAAAARLKNTIISDIDIMKYLDKFYPPSLDKCIGILRRKNVKQSRIYLVSKNKKIVKVKPGETIVYDYIMDSYGQIINANQLINLDSLTAKIYPEPKVVKIANVTSDEYICGKSYPRRYVYVEYNGKNYRLLEIDVPKKAQPNFNNSDNLLKGRIDFGYDYDYLYEASSPDPYGYIHQGMLKLNKRNSFCYNLFVNAATKFHKGDQNTRKIENLYRDMEHFCLSHVMSEQKSNINQKAKLSSEIEDVYDGFCEFNCSNIIDRYLSHKDAKKTVMEIEEALANAEIAEDSSLEADKADNQLSVACI